MTHTIRTSALLSALMLAGITAWAHHSIEAGYDLTKEVTLTGVVTKVDWSNPHVLLYLDVRDPAKGTVTNYACELGRPDRLGELGWTVTTATIGTTMSITGNPEKQGALKITAKSALAPGGRRLDTGQVWVRMPISSGQQTVAPPAAPSGTRGMPPPPPPPTPPSRR